MKERTWMLLILVALAGCGKKTPSYATGANGDYSDYYDVDTITFLAEATSNAELNAGLTSISFVTATGEQRRISDLAPGQTLVVVVTRGNTVPICPYCSTQTARLISTYESFQAIGAEVAVVYPIETNNDSARLTGFLEDVRTRLDDSAQPVPFPVLLDVELKGVDQLGIRKDLSKPATYIVDSEGVVRYAYVGEHLADRPSMLALLKEAAKYKPAAAVKSEATAVTEDPPSASLDTADVPGGKSVAE